MDQWAARALGTGRCRHLTLLIFVHVLLKKPRFGSDGQPLESSQAQGVRAVERPGHCLVRLCRSEGSCACPVESGNKSQGTQ